MNTNENGNTLEESITIPTREEEIERILGEISGSNALYRCAIRALQSAFDDCDLSYFSTAFDSVSYIDIATAYLLVINDNNVQDAYDLLKDEISTFCCEDCEGRYSYDDVHSINDRNICDDCSNSYSNCSRCDHTYDHDNGNGGRYIENIVDYMSDEIEDAIPDVVCDEIRDRFSSDADYCSNCISEMESEVREMIENANPEVAAVKEARRASDKQYDYERQQQSIRGRDVTTLEIASPDHGETVKSSRLWSCEIEHYLTRYADTCKVYQSLPDGFGLSGDGSLNSKGQVSPSGAILRDGLEIQSALLGGAKGETTITRVMQSLSDVGCEVDRTCGLHVHIDVRDLTESKNVAALVRLMAFHMIFEQVIMSFLPGNRRSGNRFCKPLATAYDFETLVKVRNVGQLEKFWYKAPSAEAVAVCKKNRYQDTRYYGVNFHSVWKHCNLEIRHHSGTLNATKTLEWANLHCRIVDYCANADTRLADLATTRAELMNATLYEMTKKLYELIGISKKSQKYLNKRQRKFAKSDAATENDLSIPVKKVDGLNTLLKAEAQEQKEENDPQIMSTVAAPIFRARDFQVPTRGVQFIQSYQNGRPAEYRNEGFGWNFVRYLDEQ